MRYDYEQPSTDYSLRRDPQQLAQSAKAALAAKQNRQGVALDQNAGTVQGVAGAEPAPSVLPPTLFSAIDQLRTATSMGPSETTWMTPADSSVGFLGRPTVDRRASADLAARAAKILNGTPLQGGIPAQTGSAAPAGNATAELAAREDKPAAKAMFIQTLKQQAQANPQQQAPGQPANPLTRDYLAGRNSQYADSFRGVADYLRWRDQNFRPATGGGWEAPSGRLYRDEDLHELYSAQQQEAARAQQRREQERHASAVASGYRTATITYPDGTTETRKGNHPQRDNNPGNMQTSKITRGHGAVGRDGPFAIFASAEDGWAALDEDLRNNYWDLSIDSAIAKYAPHLDEHGKIINNTPKYQAEVRAALGVTGGTKISSLTPKQFEALKQAIAQAEGFYDKKPHEKVKVIRTLPKQPNVIPRN